MTVAEVSLLVSGLTAAQRTALLKIGRGIRFVRIRGGWRAPGEKTLQLSTVKALLHHRLVMVSTMKRHPTLAITGTGQIAYYDLKNRNRRK